MKKTLSIVLCVLLVFLAVACNNTPEVHTVHTWDEGKQTLAPTCTTAGTKTYTCTVCGITKDEPIAATGHVHANLAKVVSSAAYIGDTVEVNCSNDGYYFYRCDVCDEVFGRAVTPKEAAAAGITVPHVVAVEGKDVPYVKSNAYNSEDLAALTDPANYDNEHIVAATELAPKYQIALCKSCGEPVEEVAQLSLNKAVDTAADEYETVVGNWVYSTEVLTSGVTKGDKLTMSIMITKSGNTYPSTIVASFYDASEGKTTTEKQEKTATLTYAKTGQTLSLDLNAWTDSQLDALDSFKLRLTSDISGFVLKNDSNPVNLVSSDAEKVVFGHACDHLSHDWKVMSWKGVATFSTSSTTADSNAGLHYLECECGLRYLPEPCTKSERSNASALSTETDVCLYCGYSKDSEKFYNVTIKEDTSPELYALVGKNVTLDLTGSEISLFNQASVKISGWTSMTNATFGDGGFSFSGDSVVTYKPAN